MEITAFQEKFDPSWIEPLQPFIESDECDKIYVWLKEKARTDRVLPDSENTFKAFEKCSLGNLRLVIMGMEPYASIKRGVPAADGLAFSNSLTGELQPSLVKFYEGIQEDVFGGTTIKIDTPADLSYLAEEGILLLNSSLTVSERKIGSHKGVWDPFIKYLIEEVLNKKENVVYILMGQEAKKWEEVISPFNAHVLTCEHPSAAARDKRKWKHEKVFSRSNSILRANKKGEVYWDKLLF